VKWTVRYHPVWEYCILFCADVRTCKCYCGSLQALSFNSHQFCHMLMRSFAAVLCHHLLSSHASKYISLPLPAIQIFLYIKQHQHTPRAGKGRVFLVRLVTSITTNTTTDIDSLCVHRTILIRCPFRQSNSEGGSACEIHQQARAAEHTSPCITTLWLVSSTSSKW
jgi:hypothetical protein